MWEEIKEFSFPFASTIGFCSIIAILIITLGNEFNLGFLLLILSPFLISWIYFLFGSHIIIKYKEPIESKKQFRRILIVAVPLFALWISTISNFLSYHVSSQSYINFAGILTFMSIPLLILFTVAIKSQLKDKSHLLNVVFLIVGIATLIYLQTAVNSIFLKWILIVLGMVSIATAAILRVKQILHGDEFEKQIHLESLAYVFPFSMLFFFFLFIIHGQFKITISERLIGYLPFATFLIYSLVAKLIRRKYS